MEITWYGHSCFRLRSSEATLVTDPFDNSVGYPLPRVRADIVTVSHGHSDHNHVAALREEPKVVDGPGEYEIKGVFITGLASFHDERKGADHGPNTIYLIEMEGLKLCHLGDLGHIPGADTLEVLSGADILFVPVGGGPTIGWAQAMELVGLLDPRIVIPMHCRTELTRSPRLETADQFLQEMGAEGAAPQPNLRVSAGGLPEETKVIVLDYRR